MNKLSFEINNSLQFYKKLEEDYSDYIKNNLSSRLAINCALTSWHLSDWIYNEYKFDKEFQNIFEFQKSLKEICGELQVMHDISNGTKHFFLNKHKPKVENTEKHIGPFDSTFGLTFDKTYLKVEMKNGEILSFETILKKVLLFWKDYLANLSKIDKKSTN